MFNYSSIPRLQTERLILRRILPDDAGAIFAFRSDFEVTRHNIGEAYTRIEQAQRLVAGIQEEFEDAKAVRWGITRQADDASTVIGMIGFNYWNPIDRRASIGFDLARNHWRTGIMSEAVQRILQFGFDEMNLNRIEADASANNTASMQLLRKLGFQQEGIQRQQFYEEDNFHDLVLFGLLHSEYLAQTL